MRYQAPLIPQTPENLDLLKKLATLTEQFGNSVNRSIGTCCCCVQWNDMLFGRNDYARLILKRTFEGKQFYVNGPDGNTLDCMFFPCTTNEIV